MGQIAVLDGSRVDAATVDDGGWALLHRRGRARPHLTCPGCDATVHAVQRRSTRFFRHDRAGSDCPCANESPRHLSITAACATAVRTAGWGALPEHPVGNRIADVLAVPPGSVAGDVGCVSVEVQLANQPADVTAVRTADHARAGSAVLWVVTRRSTIDAPDLPHIVVDVDDPHPVTAPVVVLDITDHVQVGGRALPVPRWSAAGPFPLPRVIAGILSGRLVWMSLPRGRAWPTGPSWRWVPAGQVAEMQEMADRLDVAVAAHQAVKAARRDVHLANIRANAQVRRSVTARLLDLLEGAGHRLRWPGEPKPDRSGWYAHGMVVQTASGLLYVVQPIAGQVRGGARRKLADAVVVVDTADSAARLAAVGVAAVPIDTLEIPAPIRPTARGDRSINRGQPPGVMEKAPVSWKVWNRSDTGGST